MVRSQELTGAAGLLSRLGAAFPPELDRLELPRTMGVAEASPHILFRFSYCDIPFTACVERRGNAAMLRLTGAFGPLPFSIEAARRRRRALRTLAAAMQATPLAWEVTATGQMEVAGEAEIARPLTPAAMIRAAIGLLMTGEPYLRLLLDVLGEAECLNSAAAA